MDNENIEKKDNLEVKDKDSQLDESDSEVKLEICYTCGKEFDMNSDEGAHYHYGEYPMCGYCTNFFGFYQEDMMGKK